MIRFACTCHTILEVSDEFAGTSLQCPKCKRLLDVPTLSELKGIDEEGTYKLDALKLRDEPDRLANLQRAYAPQRVDHQGQQIDLRETFKGDANAMDDDDVLEIMDAEPRCAKYDPETGELVRAVPLKQEPVRFDPATLPMAKAVINYASGSTFKEFNGWRIFPEIFRPGNLAVMGIIFLVCFMLQLIMVPIVAGFYTVVPGFVVLCIGLMAHFSNVVLDAGIERSDEFSRPLRDLNWHDDIWWPFMHFAMAFGLCYGPVVFFRSLPSAVRVPYAGAVLIMGTIAFPAAFLTTSTSGTILNLAPDRVLRMITAIGLKYPIAIFVWALAMVAGLSGLLASFVDLGTMLTTGGVPRIFGIIRIPFIPAYGLMMLGIVLMHGFCWYLGLQYRAHHEEFDWFYQKHHRKIEAVRPATGTTTSTPSIAPPMATAIAPPSGQQSDYPQSHA